MTDGGTSLQQPTRRAWKIALGSGLGVTAIWTSWALWEFPNGYEPVWALGAVGVIGTLVRKVRWLALGLALGALAVVAYVGILLLSMGPGEGF